MKKYCLRRIGAYPSSYGRAGDLWWELDENNNYIRALTAWPKKYEFGVYSLHCKDEDGHWRKIGEVSDRLCSVRIRDVQGLCDSQIKAIEHDRSDGSLDGLY